MTGIFRPAAISRLFSNIALFAIVPALSACSDPAGNVDAGIDGPYVDPQLGCSGNCHGNEESNAPPVDTTGGADTTLVGVGAHRSHLMAESGWHRRVDCRDCHQVPISLTDVGHIDTPLPAELTFGDIAQTGGLTPTWDGQACNNVYCHGGGLTGGALNQPNWTTVDGTQAACGNCHGLPPAAPHPDNNDCGGCHRGVQGGLGGPPDFEGFLEPTQHINGVVDF